jgi:mannosidase alpha-like ER degradation enhancer 1
LDPIQCIGRSRTYHDPENWGINDVLGNFSLTLVDSIDMFPIIGDRLGFEAAVKKTIDHVRFNKDSIVQVFEVNIRALGGLLSAHIFASDLELGFAIPWYNGELLHLARDLADRLLPAFNSTFGIPFARINLKNGIPVSAPHLG